jgi:type VI secretion system FHA domain protein
VELRRRDALRVGDFTLLIDRADEANPAAEETLCEAERAASPVAKDWTDEPPPAPRRRDASLVEAFCEGAKLDVSVFSSEDPAELMRRVGAVYQQTILGLAALMAERARAKAELKIDGTTIGAAGNNPFKWAPTRRLAEELLRPGSAEFKSDAEAVRASFADLSVHLAALAAGAEAAAEIVMDELSPRAIEAEVGSGGSFLRSRGASCWEVYARRHAALKDCSGPKSLGREALAKGYARRLGHLAG